MNPIYALLTYVLMLAFVMVAISLTHHLQRVPLLRRYVDETVVKVINGALIAYVIMNIIIGPVVVLVTSHTISRIPFIAF